MITINNLSIQYGPKHLFKNLSGRINSRDRIGLVGVNGAGKSTLLKILAGVSEAEPGVISQSKQVSCGYLPQEIASLDQEKSLYEEAESAFAPLLAKQRELDELNLRLGAARQSEQLTQELLRRQGELQQLLDHSNIFRIKPTIEKVLTGLGFKEGDFSKKCHSFSGGWLMRLMLAKQLLAEPSFLFLDEPTNHLDIESLTWLEEFLLTYPGALIMVSHDRAFLDNLTAITWELSLGNLTIYKGNYCAYVTQKEQRLQIQRAAYANQQALIDQTKRFIDRFRAKSTKAKQVQSRMRQLAKLEIIELEDTEQNISFRFPPAPASGRLAVAVTDLCKSYHEKRVFTNLCFELQRGDKLAIVGVNGAGKSTLVKILAGLVPADRGTIRLGHNVSLSYFGQHQAQELYPDYTVLETVTQVEAEKTITQTRSLLGAFLFRGDEVDKKVQVLSGGEKSRLALAKMIATPANLLIMDEPTNHLDMMSQEILQEALAQFDGSIIVVSHNRYFLDHFVNRVLEIKNGYATLFEGNLSYYLEKTAAERQHAQAAEPAAAPAPLSGPPGRNGAGGAPAARGKKARQEQARLREEKNSRLRPYQVKIKEAEQEIDRLEAAKQQLEAILADPELYKDQDAFSSKSREYAAVERRLARVYQQWETNQEKLEELESTFGAPF